MHVTQIEP